MNSWDCSSMVTDIPEMLKVCYVNTDRLIAPVYFIPLTSGCFCVDQQMPNSSMWHPFLQVRGTNKAATTSARLNWSWSFQEVRGCQGQVLAVLVRKMLSPTQVDAFFDGHSLIEMIEYWTPEPAHVRLFPPAIHFLFWRMTQGTANLIKYSGPIWIMFVVAHVLLIWDC